MCERPVPVPLVCADLRPGETLLQMADVLDQLEAATERVLGRVSRQAAASRRRLAGLQRRTEAISQQVCRLGEGSKALQVSSMSMQLPFWMNFS